MDEIKSIIQATVDYTIAKLKLCGLMKDNRQTAFQKTEQILRSYNDMKKSYSEDGTAKKFIDLLLEADETNTYRHYRCCSKRNQR